MKHKFQSSEYENLTTKEIKIYKEQLQALYNKYKSLNTSQRNARIKLELKKKLGGYNIVINNKSYELQTTKALLKLDALAKNEQLDTVKIEAEVVAIEAPVETTQSSEPIEPAAKVREYTIGSASSHQANKNVFSAGEALIASVLDRLNIPYSHEAVLDGLESEYGQGRQLPCDFVLNVDGRLAMIEYNGRQHYEATNDVLAYSKQVTNDARRLSFARDNGIPYLPIHYKNGSKPTIENLIDAFISDVRSNITTSKRYTNQTYGYFGEYLLTNNDLLAKVFPNINYPKLKTDKQLGYIEIDAEKVIIWEKDKLNALFNDNVTLSARNDYLYQQNNELREQIIELTKALENASEDTLV